MGKLTDRFATWLLRSVAIVMVLAGVSVLVAGLASFSMLTGPSAARTIAGVVLQLGGVFVIAGAAAIYLSVPRALLLPNERAATSDAERPAVGGWLIALAIALVALPIWMVLRLQPFLAEWRRVVEFLSTSGMWEGVGSNMGGIVLLPLAAALAPPSFELAAMLTSVAGSAILLVLLLSRSPRFPRIYLVCVVLLSGLVIASIRGADAAALTGEAIERFMQDSNPRGDEAAQLKEGLGRYTSTVSSTATALMWTLCGYLVWVPLMISSRRVQTTFASSPISTSGKSMDVEAITSPPWS